jgi:ankyrin repeat protein
LAAASIAALATVGDHTGLGRALDDEPNSVNAVHGPNRWPLLLYATYSRITLADPEWSTVETVRLLLDAGADPNAGFLWRGLVPPFTALTGALGGGESHQPWHPRRLEIARLLLDAGADPNDGQALYNNGIGGQNHDDPAHLQLLVEYGLGTQQNGPWYRQLGDRLREPGELLYDELEAAAKRDRPTILRYLLSLGLDPTRPIGRSQLPPARIAAAKGHDAILDVLIEHGIDPNLTPVDHALRCTRTDDVDALGDLLDHHAELLDDLRRDHPSLCRNVTAGDQSMLSRLIQLGFDINDRSTTKTPLHHAAEAGDTNQARLLIAHGADPNLRDTHIGATPWGWANHNGHTETADYLHPLTDHDDTLPEITITSPIGPRTLVTPELIDAHLDDIHNRHSPTLATLRHDRTALTIGLGHPDMSVALYLDHDNVPWNAIPEQPSAPPGDKVVWASSTGDKRFFPDAYLASSEARAVASAFIANPGEQPALVEWQREGAAT